MLFGQRGMRSIDIVRSDEENFGVERMLNNSLLSSVMRRAINFQPYTPNNRMAPWRCPECDCLGIRIDSEAGSLLPQISFPREPALPYLR